MSMVTPQSIALIKSLIDAKQGDHVTIHKAVLRGIISEIEQLQAAQTDDEAKKIDFIQRLSIEQAINSLCDSLSELALRDFGQLTANEVLTMAAKNLRYVNDQSAVPVGGTS